jgi:nitric oxide reductase activation protein
MMDQLESAGAKCKTVGDGLWKKPTAIVYHRVDETIVRDSLFPFGGPNRTQTSVDAVNSGTQMGHALAYRIRVMQDEYLLKFNRQNHGKLDKRALAGFGYGAENGFMLDQIVRMKPVFVHLTIDASGSMSGYRWKNALMLAVSLAVAASKTRNMDVSISIRAGIGFTSRSNSDETVGIAIIYDSRKDSIQKIRSVFPYLHVAGATPEGLAFEAIMEQIVHNQKEQVRKFFVNLSDGEPAFYGYGGASGVDHTRKQVNKIRASGTRVLSYFVGDSYAEGDFRTMYGKDAAFIQPDSIPEIARTLNKMFMEE